VELQDQSRCIPDRHVLDPIYRWLGLEDPVGFDKDLSYMTVYNTTSLFDYNYTSTSILGLCFYVSLPEQTSGVLIQRALVVIPLSHVVNGPIVCMDTWEHAHVSVALVVRPCLPCQLEPANRPLLRRPIKTSTMTSGMQDAQEVHYHRLSFP
jgi:hypothetical protein